MASDLTAWFNIARGFSETENIILLGQSSGSISGMQERCGAASKGNSGDNQKQETKDKKFSDLLDTIQSIQNYMDRLAKSIEQLEDTFRQRDGDAWREKLALKILGEDDIPQRRSGESIEAYRERLGILLVDELLNADGSIKAKYKNHPELSDYAEWAQKQYHLNNAKVIAAELDNGNTSPQRRNEIIGEMKDRRSTEEMVFTDREANDIDTKNSVRNARDETQDVALQDDNSATLPDFLNLKT